MHTCNEKCILYRNILSATQRNFVKEHPGCSEMKNFHSKFKDWLAINHPAIDDDKWTDLVHIDQAHDYIKYPLCNPPVEETVQLPSPERSYPENEIVEDINSNMYSFKL